ncbi:uncharacterized protein LOC142181102 [Nicotiana tabacum]|uniref:Uncharacterized protein LOC142181102 n=1 Tax=Nicotiana tabacum TaxID=4097 RepID=A0AC58UIX1_TOBAC
MGALCTISSIGETDGPKRKSRQEEKPRQARLAPNAQLMVMNQLVAQVDGLLHQFIQLAKKIDKLEEKMENKTGKLEELIKSGFRRVENILMQGTIYNSTMLCTFSNMMRNMGTIWGFLNMPCFPTIVWGDPDSTPMPRFFDVVKFLDQPSPSADVPNTSDPDLTPIPQFFDAVDSLDQPLPPTDAPTVREFARIPDAQFCDADEFLSQPPLLYNTPNVSDTVSTKEGNIFSDLPDFGQLTTSDAFSSIFLPSKNDPVINEYGQPSKKTKRSRELVETEDKVVQKGHVSSEIEDEVHMGDEK